VDALTLEKWQEKLDKDFPNALTCHREGSDTSFRSLCLTPYGFEGENIKLMFFAWDHDGYDFRLVFRPDSYKQIQAEPNVPMFQIECTDGQIWTFADSIPASIANGWKFAKADQRKIAARGGV
jgi:hypothetical protein